MQSPVKESILYPRASHHCLRCGKGQLNYLHPFWPTASDMGPDSITQTLSNPDCGLSKPHIPDNSPYISHRVIRPNGRQLHPQPHHTTHLSLSHPRWLHSFFYDLPFLLAFFSLSVGLCSSHLSSTFVFSSPVLRPGCSLVMSTSSVHLQLLFYSQLPFLWLSVHRIS